MLADMKQSTLVAELKAMLGADTVAKFTGANDADFKRHLDVAAADFPRKVQRIARAELALVADQRNYAAPDDLKRVSYATWGTRERKARKPWDNNYPHQLPSVSVVSIDGDAQELHLDPPPTTEQIADLGATYGYYYYAAHSVSDVAGETTIKPEFAYLLLVRAMAAAMTELASWGVTKPVNFGHAPGISMPKNGTPAALAEFFLKQFEAMAA